MANNPFPAQPEPQVITTDTILKTKPFLKLPNKKLIIGFLIILLVIISGVVSYVLINKSSIKNEAKNIPTIPTQKPKVLSAKEELEQTIKQTFTKPQDQDIVKYIGFASGDRTLETKFLDYSKAYQLIYERYQNNAPIEVKKALIKLRAYVRPFPQFKEADFKLIR